MMTLWNCYVCDSCFTLCFSLYSIMVCRCMDCNVQCALWLTSYDNAAEWQLRVFCCNISPLLIIQSRRWSPVLVLFLFHDLLLIYTLVIYETRSLLNYSTHMLLVCRSTFLEGLDGYWDLRSLYNLLIIRL